MILQGSDEWHAMRIGKVTASRVADIMRKGRSGAVSATRQRYLGELVAERLTGRPTEGFKSADMQWGNDTEAQAISTYTVFSGATLSPVAFVDHPTIGMCGASPDHFVDGDGLVEIKCPATHTHIATLLGDAIAPDYMTQMQWQMACTGRAWCDWVSFDPRLPEDMQLHVQRVDRNGDKIKELEAAVIEFLAELDETVSKLRTMYMQEAA